MLLSEEEARKKWCPAVRIEGSNRVYNALNDGFQHAEPSYRCVGRKCMCWRELHLSHMKGEGIVADHGYCGLGGKPDFE